MENILWWQFLYQRTHYPSCSIKTAINYNETFKLKCPYFTIQNRRCQVHRLWLMKRSLRKCLSAHIKLCGFFFFFGKTVLNRSTYFSNGFKTRGKHSLRNGRFSLQERGFSCAGLILHLLACSRSSLQDGASRDVLGETVLHRSDNFCTHGNHVARKITAVWLYRCCYVNYYLLFSHDG